MSMWEQISGVNGSSPRTELLLELDPHYCCQPGGDSRYCGAYCPALQPLGRRCPIESTLLLDSLRSPPLPCSEILHRRTGDQHGSGVGSGYYALRQGDWKLLVGDPAGGEGDGWYCSGAPCNYTGWEPSPVNLTAGSVQLYNIATDPRESQDQAGAQPLIVAQLMAALQKYNATAEPAYICGARGDFNVGGALTPWCTAGGEQSGCTSPPPDQQRDY